jgi:hypothetical protein
MLVDEYDFRCGNVKNFFKKNFPFITIEAAYRRSKFVYQISLNIKKL